MPERFSRRAFARSALAGVGASVISSPAIAAAKGSAETAKKTQLHNQGIIDSLFDVEVPLYDWKWIVVHHTASKAGWLKGIDRYHRNHFGDPLGAEYHFVINNGRKLPIGHIEVARWRYQEPAWHLFKPEKAPAGIAICLVGNFEEQKVHKAQLASLIDLSAALMRGLSIDSDHITTHRGVDGILTQCPGKNFPFDDYLEALKQRERDWKAEVRQAPTQRTAMRGPTLRCLL
jgi:hypothetical protein